MVRFGCLRKLASVTSAVSSTMEFLKSLGSERKQCKSIMAKVIEMSLDLI